MARLLSEALERKRVREVAVIILGNPDKMKGQEKLAHEYYEEIAQYIEAHGFGVETDPGEPRTCPRTDAAFWVAHSRGVDRDRCINKKDLWRFLKFGALEGYIHPVDAKWQAGIVSHLSPDLVPPKEHFEFIQSQKDAIDDVVARLKKK